MKITVNNFDISDKLLEYKISAEMSSDSLIIGNAVSKQITMKLDNQDNEISSLLDYPFFVSNDGTNPTGKFRVYEKPERYTGELSLTLYDDMYLFSQRYDTKLEYPTTVQSQLDEMSQITGVIINTDGLSEQTLSKEVNWYDNTISMRNYLGWIAELDGCNCFADANGTIVFRELASTTHNTVDVETYDKAELVQFTRICFDDGVLKIEEGTDTGNTLYISSNNGYIDSDTSLLAIYNKYKGLIFYSVSDVKMANIDGWYLTDLVNYNDEFLFMPLSISETYSGGQYSVATVSGLINTQNNESVINKIDVSVKIKRIQTIVDKNNQSLEILAQDLEDGLGEISSLKIEVGKITQKTESTSEKVEQIENTISLVLRNNLPLTQVYETATQLFTPDYTKQNLVITAEAVTLDKSDVSALCDFTWKRKTRNGESDLIEGETASGNTLTVTKNTLANDNPVEYICTAAYNEQTVTASVSLGLNVIGQDGESVKGEDGKTYYVHIRYSNDGGATFTSNDGLVAGSWMGQYTDENENASSDVSRYTWSQIKGDNGENAITCKIIPSATVFTVIKLEDGTLSTTPNSIILTGVCQNCNFAGWYFSSDGITYEEVTSGSYGLSISEETNELTISNESELYESYKSIVFKLTTDIATCQDTVTIIRNVDNTYIDNELGSIKDEIEKVTYVANNAMSEIDAVKGSITDTITNTATTIIDDRLTVINEQMAIFEETINGLDITKIENKTNELGEQLDEYREYLHLGTDRIEIGKSTSSIKTVITNDKFAIQEDGVDIAYVSAKKLFIQSALILTDIVVGNDTHGYYRWGVRSNGNYSLTYKTEV